MMHELYWSYNIKMLSKNGEMSFLKCFRMMAKMPADMRIFIALPALGFSLWKIKLVIEINNIV